MNATPIDLGNARFDWYQATIVDGSDLVIAALCEALNGETKRTPGMHGFAHTDSIMRDGSAIARVMHGGIHSNPNVTCSSDDTDEVHAVMRRLWPAPRHRVTRADTSIDYQDDAGGTWDRISGLALAHALDTGIKIEHAGDWARGIDGRTLYLGSRKSAVMVRVYEKGVQLQQRNPGFEGFFSRDLVRVEVQVRPEKDSRLKAAICHPEELFGFANWTAGLLAQLEGYDVDRTRIRERRESDRDRALRWMVKQYGAHLRDLVDELAAARDLEPGSADAWGMLGAWVLERMPADS